MKKFNRGKHPEIRDYGPMPFIFNINHATCMNQSYRTTLWTGHDLQLTLMSIPPKGDIGVEMHCDVDQFIRIEKGLADIYMGRCKDSLHRMGSASEGYAVIIPAGTWHNVINVGSCPLKLYSLYAPPKHPQNTIHKTKMDAALS